MHDGHAIGVALVELELGAADHAITHPTRSGDLEDLWRMMRGPVQGCRTQPTDVILDGQVRGEVADDFDSGRSTPGSVFGRDRDPQAPGGLNPFVATRRGVQPAADLIGRHTKKSG